MIKRPRARWRFMYALSCSIGYVLGSVLWLAGHRWSKPMGVMVRATAREHADGWAYENRWPE